MNFAGTGMAAVFLASMGTLAGCGGDGAMGDMNVSVDMRRPPDLTALVDNDLAKGDMAMGMADMSMQDMAMASMQDMAVVAMDDLSASSDGPLVPGDGPLIVGDGPLIVGDGPLIVGDGPLIVGDASIPDGGVRPDFFFIPGDIGIVDAIMDGPGRLGDTPNCTGAPTGACQTCIGQNCANQVTAAFGANWQTRDTGSVCDGVYACSCSCMNLGGNNCLQMCVQQKGGQCTVPFNTFATCVMNNCANPCK